MVEVENDGQAVPEKTEVATCNRAGEWESWERLGRK